MSELIQPVKSGRELLDEMEHTLPPEPGVAVWWLGQSGFVIKSREATIYVDPYLSEHLTNKYRDTEKPHVRMTASPFDPDLAANADLVLSTHKHSDHMDPVTIPAILGASVDARYVIPRAHRDHVLGWGLDEARLVLADVDELLAFPGVEIAPQPAAHEMLDYDEETGYPHMSYIIKTGGVVLYHSGDTVPYRGMAERIARHRVDVAFLPINGRDRERHAHGTPGNCTIEEALTIAVVANVATIVPHHYDMFTFNTVDIDSFREWADEAFPRQDYRVLRCGDASTFTPRYKEE